MAYYLFEFLRIFNHSKKKCYPSYIILSLIAFNYLTFLKCFTIIKKHTICTHKWAYLNVAQFSWVSITYGISLNSLIRIVWYLYLVFVSRWPFLFIVDLPRLMQLHESVFEVNVKPLRHHWVHGSHMSQRSLPSHAHTLQRQHKCYFFFTNHTFYLKAEHVSLPKTWSQQYNYKPFYLRNRNVNKMCAAFHKHANVVLLCLLTVPITQ